MDQNGKTVVIGDIHGCYDELLALLDQIKLTPIDRVIAVGDLITKGPKNSAVLDLFSSDSRFLSVIGNQDLVVLRYCRGEPVTLTNAQEETCRELETSREKYQSYLA